MILNIYKLLYNEYGPQGWWPANSQLEMCIGAILTQNTSWKNAEMAIKNLGRLGLLEKEKIIGVPLPVIEAAVMPSGFYRQKAARISEFCSSVDFGEIERLGTEEARERLLSINGIGKETADSMLLYAFGKPIFVIDAYTKRIYGRVSGNVIDGYEELRLVFEQGMPRDVQMYNEMHALLVEHAKRHCTKRKPKCSGCPLRDMCKMGSVAGK